MKEGGAKRKGAEEAEEISKNQSQKFPVFSKKNASLNK